MKTVDHLVDLLDALMAEMSEEMTVVDSVAWSVEMMAAYLVDQWVALMAALLVDLSAA